MNFTKRLILVILLVLITTAVCATVFSYRYFYGTIHVGPPVVWFEDPFVPRVNVTLYRSNTWANVTLHALPIFTLEYRAAIFFDTFDTNPFAYGRMLALGCNWSWDPVMRAVYINGTQPYPLTWGRECIAVANINVSSYARAGRAIYVAFLFWRTPINITEDVWADAVYVNTSLNNLYTIGWWLKAVNPGRTGDHVHPNIYFWRGSFPWTRYFDAHLDDYLPTFEEYILSSVVSMINFSNWLAALYNYTASYTATVPATDRRFIDLVGIGINSINRDRRDRDVPRNFTGSIYFDNLVVTVDREPWVISLVGVPAGWRVVLRDHTGRVLANVTSPSPTVLVNITIWPPFADLLVDPYNRTGFVFVNATLEAYDATDRLVSTTVFDYIVGGDIYRFGTVYEFKGTILSAYSNLTSGFYVMLANATAPIKPGVVGDIGFITADGRRPHENITIRGGVILRPETTPLLVHPPYTWHGKWLVINITVEIRVPKTELPYNLHFNLLWWSTSGIVVAYPVNVTVVPHILV